MWLIQSGACIIIKCTHVPSLNVVENMQTMAYLNLLATGRWWPKQVALFQEVYKEDLLSQMG